jgi:DNA-directed RNA polymerase subunit H (RpoH/RPB5)
MDSKNINIDCLNILNNILQLLENKKYLYLGTNYEKIKNDIKTINNKNINVNLEKKIDDYTNIIKNKKYSILVKKNNKYILVLFYEAFVGFQNNIDVNYIYKNINLYFSENIYWEKIVKVYIICPDEFEEQIKRKIDREEINSVFETIKYTNLLYNPTQHKYFPKHEKIKNYEHKYKKYNIKLPILLKKDIASKWYGYETNDIIKITRTDKTIFYRIVKDKDN